MIKGLEILYIVSERKFMVRYRNQDEDRVQYVIEWFPEVEQARKRALALGVDTYNTQVKRVEPWNG